MPILFTACERNEDDDTLLKFFGSASEDIGYSIAIADDGYLICGQMTVISRSEDDYRPIYSKKMGIIKTGFDGNILTSWKNKTFGDSTAMGSKIIELDDGSVICAGHIIDKSTQKDIFVVKLSSDGSQVVQKIYKADGNQNSSDILKTQEGFLILGTTDVERLPVTDSTGNRAGMKDILLMRINNNLEQIATPSALGFPGNDISASLKPDIGGGYIIVGTTDMSEPGMANNNILLVKINADGSATHPAIVGGTYDEYAADMEVLDDGYLISGTIGSESSVQSAFTSKIPRNISAAPLFTKKIEKTVSWSVKAMSRYKSNYFVLAGQQGSASSAKMLIFVVDSEGNLVEGKEKITGSTGIQVAYDVVSDSDDYIITVGKNSYESNSMISLFKFRF